MKLKLLLCARDVVTDQATQDTVVIGLIDEIGSPAFPFMLPQLAVFALFTRSLKEPEKRTVRLEMVSATAEVFAKDVDLDFQGKGRLRQTLRFAGFPIEEPGTITISFKAKGKTLGSYEADFSKVGPIQLQQAAGVGMASPASAATSKNRRKSGKSKRS